MVQLLEAEPQLWRHLHLPALSLWPYLVGALRRQHEAVESNDDLQVSLNQASATIFITVVFMYR